MNPPHRHTCSHTYIHIQSVIYENGAKLFSHRIFYLISFKIMFEFQVKLLSIYAHIQEAEKWGELMAECVMQGCGGLSKIVIKKFFHSFSIFFSCFPCPFGCY